MKHALYSICNETSPGPDGYNAMFYKYHWNNIRQILTHAIQRAFRTGKFVKVINHTVLTLIPKTTNPTSIGDFRPIACCNMLYKILAKVLCGRLKHALSGLILEHQTAFLPGRHIFNGVLLAHERIIISIKRDPTKCTLKLI